MTRARPRRSTTFALVTLGVALVLAVIATALGRDVPPVESGTGPAGTPGAPLTELSPRQAGQAFLQAYVDPDGRVVRRDQGGDTVSEGQAYALLVAAALGDRDTLTRVWAWTEQNLRRPDGTLSWRWAGGRVVDESSAADADLDAARALVVAGRALDDPQLLAAGAALGTAVLEVETVSTGLGRILVAGNWATEAPWAYNPSYASPAAVAVLASASGDPRWAELAQGSRAATTAVLDGGDLPPDWAQVQDSGAVEATPGAAGRGDDGVVYGYDATRLPLRYAESCDPADVALAARLAGPLSRYPGTPASRELDGRPRTDVRSVVAVAAQAAVAAAAGDADSAHAHLVEADHLQQQSPTYYGGAWDALGRLLLSDGALGGCPPLTR